jgi:hypothetical protein
MLYCIEGRNLYNKLWHLWNESNPNNWFHTLMSFDQNSGKYAFHQTHAGNPTSVFFFFQEYDIWLLF